MLKLENVSKYYGSPGRPVLALDSVSLEIAKGTLCALTGASGSGKTTLMNLIGLLDRPASGDIFVAGKRVGELSEDEVARLRNREIGFVFQYFHLLPRYSALDNVALPLLYRGISKARRREIAQKALQLVGLGKRVMRRPDELSGGQRQRVAIARALVGNPAILLADEPTGNLDSQSAAETMSLFARLNAEFGLTVIIVTHDHAIASRCPHRIVMRDGQIVDDQQSRSLGL
ncbi:ABC transporter ATP-binding protein [Brucella intermedia]